MNGLTNVVVYLISSLLLLSISYSTAEEFVTIPKHQFYRIKYKNELGKKSQYILGMEKEHAQKDYPVIMSLPHGDKEGGYWKVKHVGKEPKVFQLFYQHPGEKAWYKLIVGMSDNTAYLTQGKKSEPTKWKAVVKNGGISFQMQGVDKSNDKYLFIENEYTVKVSADAKVQFALVPVEKKSKKARKNSVNNAEPQMANAEEEPLMANAEEETLMAVEEEEEMAAEEETLLAEGQEPLAANVEEEMLAEEQVLDAIEEETREEVPMANEKGFGNQQGFGIGQPNYNQQNLGQNYYNTMQSPYAQSPNMLSSQGYNPVQYQQQFQPRSHPGQNYYNTMQNPVHYQQPPLQSAQPQNQRHVLRGQPSNMNLHEQQQQQTRGGNSPELYQQAALSPQTQQQHNTLGAHAGNSRARKRRRTEPRFKAQRPVLRGQVSSSNNRQQNRRREWVEGHQHASQYYRSQPPNRMKVQGHNNQAHHRQSSTYYRGVDNVGGTYGGGNALNIGRTTSLHNSRKRSSANSRQQYRTVQQHQYPRT